MYHIFRRKFRCVVFLAVFSLSGSQVFAQTADMGWQALVDEYGDLMKQGQHAHALEVAHKALALAESDPDKDQKNVALSLNNLAFTYGNLAQYDKALPLFQHALAIHEIVSGPEHPDTALSLNNLASTYSGLAQYDKALPLFQRALAIHEIVSGPEHPDTALSLNNLAFTYKELADYDKVLPLFQRALAIHEKTLGPEHPRTALSLNNLALTNNDLAQYEKALPLFQRALAINEKTLRSEHPDTAKTLSNLAFTHSSLAQYEKALPLFQRALAISEKALGPEHPHTAKILNNLSVTYLLLAEYEKALLFFQRALAINEKTLDLEHPDTATSLSNLASIYSSLAQYDKALPLEHRALAIRDMILGAEHPETAKSLNNLALTYSSLAQYDKALPLFQRALAIREKALGPEHPDTAESLNNLALTYSSLAQYDKALPLFQPALAIREKALGLEHPDTAESLNNLASIYQHLAQYDKARPHYQHALAIYEKTLGSEHPKTALILNNLASNYMDFAQYDKALPLQQRALSIYEKALGPYHPDTALSLGNLAFTFRYLAQYDMALPLEQRALAIREKALGPNHPRTALSLNNLAFTFKEMGQSEMAIAFYKSAVNAYQSQREQVSRIDETALRSYTESVTYTYQALANLLIDEGLLPDAQLVLDMLKENEQFDFIRRSAIADSRRTRIGYNTTEQNWMSRYRQIADQLSALGVEEQILQKQAKIGLSAAQKQRLPVLSADLQVAQAAFQSFLKEMRENFARLGPAKAAEASATSIAALAELQGLLKGIGHDAVLLQYYVTDDKVGMLLTTPGVQLARSTNVSAKELNRQIAVFRRLLRDPKVDTRKASHALYQLLVAPVAQDLEQSGAKTVMLSLDGALRYLPFGALHDGNRYMVERWNLPLYTSVTKNRLRDSVTPQWTAAGLGVTLALGKFDALPAVQAEMNSIIKTSGGGVLPGEVYLDKAFTAQRLQDVSQRPFQLLHIASHFQFSPGTEVNSFLLLGDGKQLTLGDIRTQNYRFDNVDLLTLSACDTGLGGGRDAQGKEIEGFGVLAQQQGAKAVLATLWPVADASTSKLMTEMYSRRQAQSLTKIEALRQAQLSLLSTRRYAHPHFWAPFILMGNWK